MSIDALCDRLPEYAKDIAANLKALADDDKGLTDSQKWGCFLACAYAIGTPGVVADVEEGCPLPDGAKTAAKAAAAIMGMNNVYYRALHMMKNPEYATMPAKLRMSVIAKLGSTRSTSSSGPWRFRRSTVAAPAWTATTTYSAGTPCPPPQFKTALRIASVVNAASRIVAAEVVAAAPLQTGGDRPDKSDDQPGYPTSAPAPAATPIPAG